MGQVGEPFPDEGKDGNPRIEDCGHEGGVGKKALNGDGVGKKALNGEGDENSIPIQHIAISNY